MANRTPPRAVPFVYAIDFDVCTRCGACVAACPEKTVIGIIKGKPFNPDARMRKILTDAVAIGDATARAITDWEGTDTLPMWHGKTVYYPADARPAHRRGSR